MALPTCSLIISTYNWPQALQLCLESVRQQKVMPQEVFIADDGSGEETRTLIQQFQKNFPVPLHHVWHPDNGFQRAKILNRTIAQTNNHYVVQIDGDVIVHPRFVEDHLSLATEGRFLAGGGINLSQEISKEVLAKKTANFGLFDIVKTSN